jgi:hypothetical protein
LSSADNGNFIDMAHYSNVTHLCDLNRKIGGIPFVDYLISRGRYRSAMFVILRISGFGDSVYSSAGEYTQENFNRALLILRNGTESLSEVEYFIYNCIKSPLICSDGIFDSMIAMDIDISSIVIHFLNSSGTFQLSKYTTMSKEDLICYILTSPQGMNVKIGCANKLSL